MGLRETILQSDDRPLAGPYEVPEWGTQVWGRPMATEAFARFAMKHADEAGAGVLKGDALAEVVSDVLCDEQGAQVFTLEDAEALLAKNGQVMARVGTWCLGVCGYSDAAVKETEKNLGVRLSGG